jgi:hypothetical protein
VARATKGKHKQRSAAEDTFEINDTIKVPRKLVRRPGIPGYQYT